MRECEVADVHNTLVVGNYYVTALTLVSNERSVFHDELALNLNGKTSCKQGCLAINSDLKSNSRITLSLRSYYTVFINGSNLGVTR